jgi:hypothetical protein
MNKIVKNIISLFSKEIPKEEGRRWAEKLLKVAELNSILSWKH